jgi:hypothetical protein
MLDRVGRCSPRTRYRHASRIHRDEPPLIFLCAGAETPPAGSRADRSSGFGVGRPGGRRVTTTPSGQAAARGDARGRGGVEREVAEQGGRPAGARVGPRGATAASGRRRRAAGREHLAAIRCRPEPSLSLERLFGSHAGAAEQKMPCHHTFLSRSFFFLSGFLSRSSIVMVPAHCGEHVTRNWASCRRLSLSPFSATSFCSLVLTKWVPDFL